MSPRKTNRPRPFVRHAVCLFVVGHLYTTFLPLMAQSESPASPAPASPTSTSPNAPSTAPPLQPIPATAASSPTSSSSTLSTPTAPSSPVGLTPVSGPGSVLTPILGEHLGSAYTSDRIPFHVTATLAEVYNNNIFAQAQKESDYITRLAVAGEAQFGNLRNVDGNYVDLLYKPSLHLYASHPHENGVDQNVDFLYAHHFTRLTLSLEQIYSDVQSTNAAIGGLVDAETFDTKANANYAYSPKLDIVGSVSQDFISFNNAEYTDSKEWVGSFYALYHVDPKLSLGFGPRFGYLNLDKSPNETYQQIIGRAIYVISDKLKIQGAVGGEDRQYQTGGRSDTIEPIFELSGNYYPFPSSSVSLNSSRRFSPAYDLLGQDYIATNVNVAASQRFLDAYYFGLTAGYENDDYQYVDTTENGPTREDNYFYVQPNLRWSPAGWYSVAVFDRYEEDNSNFDVFSYDANQVGVSFSAIY